MKRKPPPRIELPDVRSIGYARVSTRDQNLDLQEDALRKAGVLPENLHVEKLSATTRLRPNLDEAIKQVRPGDTFLVWRLDRLARSNKELYDRLDQIHANGGSFRSLTENFDFTTATGQLIMGIFALMAQFERQLTVERTKAGIAVAKAQGKRFGAKPKFTPEIKAKAFKMLTTGGKTAPEVAKHFKVAVGTIYNHFQFEHDERTGKTYVSEKLRTSKP